MSKKNKRQPSKNNVIENIMEPYVVNMDVLACISDDELRDRNHQLNEEMNSASRAGYDSYLWEVELAYVQREIDIRHTRRALHERYMRSNPEAVYYADSFPEEEENLSSEVN